MILDVACARTAGEAVLDDAAAEAAPVAVPSRLSSLTATAVALAPRTAVVFRSVAP